MKEIDEVLKTLADGLRSMSLGISAIAAKVDDLSKEKETAAPKPKKKSSPGKKPAAKAPKKSPSKPAAKAAARKKPAPAAARETAAAVVYGLIARSKKGVDMATLQAKTGFGSKKIANILYKLKKQEKVKSMKRGVYTKV